ncbi:MAG: hypothetical protein FWG80_01915 [Alphaproteobacteria bacterium]|nr:hypothetical protein [Alphaproteobacteria bacterium]
MSQEYQDLFFILTVSNPRTALYNSVLFHCPKYPHKTESDCICKTWDTDNDVRIKLAGEELLFRKISYKTCDSVGFHLTADERSIKLLHKHMMDTCEYYRNASCKKIKSTQHI